MDAARWERVQEILHGGIALRDEARRRFLERACDGDPGLLSEVEELLSADGRPSSVLDGGVERVAGRLLAEPEAPRQIGPYRITGVLGQGGMGVVYRAERDDLGRAVAVKVLRDGWLSPERRSRFAVEQRILARLDHPGIARLYDADVLPDGTPWFAMELVDGEPITAWCERRRSGLTERLALFRAVCEAVAFAQRLAVVHRDLKPSNLLVDASGQVKLLDFGIARHLDPAGEGTVVTRTGLRLMTPAYAAPEQLRGEPPGLPTDVWALGVLLFELQTGKRPFDRPERTTAEVELAVLNEEPERPSAAARRAGVPLSGSLGTWRELDVLCLTALRKEPHRRYASAEALLRDVDHLLAGRPLDAQADRAGYRVRKFVGRHRAEVAAAALVAVALAAAVTVFTVRLARARDAAVAEAARAQHVQAFLQQLLSGGDQAAGPSADLKVVDLLAAGEREVEALGTDPATQADLLATLGITAQRLGLLDRADALLGRALERHRALPGDTTSAVVSDLQELGQLRVDQARYEEAERLAREATGLARARLPGGHPARSSTLVILGRVLTERGRLPEAAAALQEAVALQSRPGAPQADLAFALRQLADLRVSEGMADEAYEESMALCRRAARIWAALNGEDSEAYASGLTCEATAALRQGKEPVRAEHLLRRALAIKRAVLPAGHGVLRLDEGKLGFSLLQQRRFAEAESLLRGAFEHDIGEQGRAGPWTMEAGDLLAQALRGQGRQAEAAALEAEQRQLRAAAVSAPPDPASGSSR